MNLNESGWILMNLHESARISKNLHESMWIRNKTGVATRGRERAEAGAAGGRGRRQCGSEGRRDWIDTHPIIYIYI